MHVNHNQWLTKPTKHVKGGGEVVNFWFPKLYFGTKSKCLLSMLPTQTKLQNLLPAIMNCACPYRILPGSLDRCFVHAMRISLATTFLPHNSQKQSTKISAGPI